MNAHDLALKHFNLQLPCTQDMLKSAFRATAKRLHSDVGGTDAAFVEMKAVYDQLCAAPGILVDVIDDRERTFEGVLLSELGLGLGPTVNGRDCPRCERKGYTTTQYSYPEKCKRCNGHGDIMICRACHGSGQYTNPVGRKVPCRRCNAKGFWPAPKINPRNYWDVFMRRAPGAQGCPDCHATGQTQVMVNKFTYYKCGECNGTGEIKIYNPVILKNGLGNQRQRKAAR